MKVKNKRCIRNISFKQFRAAKTRNLIAIFAIALTTLMFTSLFTIAFSLNASYEEITFRQVGGYSHGTFKEVTDENVEAISAHRSIKDYGLRTIIGFSAKEPFTKTPAEISWMDANTTKWSYAIPTTGHMPEAENEIAMDTEALKKLGITANLGEKVILTYNYADNGGYFSETEERTDEFTLVGFWESDKLLPVHYINVSKAYLDSVEKEHIESGYEAFRTDMNVMLATSLNIRGVLEAVDADLGYQWEDVNKDNCVRIGTNWGYTTVELGSNIDPTAVLSIVSFLLLVIFTGYLVIYNIFQIAVSNDIRFYGLLKTIGATPGQLKQIVRQQAFYLSILGIPIGCVLGYGVGAVLTPVIISTLEFSNVKVSTTPLIFIGAALFSLVTVLISCTRPGKKAANITPVEAIRYTESVSGKKKKRSTKGVTVHQMAYANLGRNRMKTALVILSLSLAVVLLNCVFMFTNGFSMEKYIDYFLTSDFVVGTPAYFRYDGCTPEAALSDESVAEVQSNTNTSLAGSAYVLSGDRPQGWLNAEEYKNVYGDKTDQMIQLMIERNKDREGLYQAEALLEGMDEALLKKLDVYDGSLDALSDPTQHAIALVADVDDYGNICDTVKKVGDELTITYVEEGHVYDRRTGELCTEDTPAEFLEYRVVKSHDVIYKVCAIVGVPYGVSFRFSTYGFEAVLSSEALKQDSILNVHRMFYLFDTPDEESEKAAESFLAEYTGGDNSGIMYESKEFLRKDLENFRRMFLLVGTVLCFIVGLVGILNFFNAVLTGIISRYREFAMLQSVGMTGKQLKQMLVYEGIFYAAGAGLLTIVLSLVLNPLVGQLFEKMFWFFSYKFTIMPVFVITPVFILVGVLLPLVIYRFTVKKSVVERLRETE